MYSSTHHVWMNRIDIKGDDDCWPWMGGCTGAGYGVVNIDGEDVYVHRLMLEVKLGTPLPPGIESCHTCDYPPCCNPAHLFPGTRQDNASDMVAKERSARHENHSQAVLNWEKVEQIRSMYASGGWSYRKLGRHFGVSYSTISSVVRYQDWVR